MPLQCINAKRLEHCEGENYEECTLEAYLQSFNVSMFHYGMQSYEIIVKYRKYYTQKSV